MILLGDPISLYRDLEPFHKLRGYLEENEKHTSCESYVAYLVIIADRVYSTQWYVKTLLDSDR